MKRGEQSGDNKASVAIKLCRFFPLHFQLSRATRQHPMSKPKLSKKLKQRVLSYTKLCSQNFAVFAILKLTKNAMSAIFGRIVALLFQINLFA